MKTLLMLSLVTVLCLMIVPAAPATDETTTIEGLSMGETTAEEVVGFSIDEVLGCYTITTVKTILKDEVVKSWTYPRAVAGTVITGGYFVPRPTGYKEIYIKSATYSLFGIWVYTLRTGNYWRWYQPKVTNHFWLASTIKDSDMPFVSTEIVSTTRWGGWIEYLGSPYGCRYKAVKHVVAQSMPLWGVVKKKNFTYE